MLATLAEPPLTRPGLVYEPKYDGIRALVAGAAGRRPATACASGRGSATKRRRSSRRSCARSNGCAQGLTGPLLLDGEIVALDAKGRPAGFQRLQGRIHLTGARDVEQIDKAQPVALIAFDLLRDGDEDLRGLPLTERRARLEAAASARTSSDDAPHQRAGRPATAARCTSGRTREGWEGLIVKEARVAVSVRPAQPGLAQAEARSTNRSSSSAAGPSRGRRASTSARCCSACYDEKTGALIYVGHTGTGFNQAELERASGSC